MAHAATDEPDGPRARNRHLDASSELHRNGTVAAESADDRADRRTASGAAPRAQRAAARGGLRARLSRTRARQRRNGRDACDRRACAERRSEEHTSELQSLMRTSYAVFCLTKKQ